MKIIDLRSDTVTKPSTEMRQAIFDAKVGDDVFGDDPTVKLLENYAAELLGKEAAIFVTSGTQGNLLSLLSHCQRGEEVIAGMGSHIFRWEAGGSCVLGGLAAQPIEFEQDSTLALDKIKKAIKPDDPHFAVTKLLALENTQSGKVLPMNYLKDFSIFAKEHRLSTHLDGARMFNAAVALNLPAKEIAKHFDSVTFCLSKGLGAPVGSLVASTHEFIQKAKRLRKMVGGSMRQTGLIAAAGLYALKNNVNRLKEDHDNAKLLADSLNEIDRLQGKAVAHTNMVFVEVGEAGVSMPEYFASHNITILGSKMLRLVTHLDITHDDILRVIAVFKNFFNDSKFSVSKEQHAKSKQIYD